MRSKRLREGEQAQDQAPKREMQELGPAAKPAAEFTGLGPAYYISRLLA